MTKEELKIHFQYNWLKYLAIAAAAVIIWLSLFSIIAAPKATEKLYIAFAGNNFDYTLLQSELNKNSESICGKKLKEISVVTAENGTTVFHQQLFAFSQSADFVIIEDDDMPEDIGKTYFAPLNEEDITKRFGETELYKENGQIYAFKIEGGNFSNYYSGNKPCWVFLTVTSENLSLLNGKGNKEDDSAIKVLEYLLGDNNVQT